jgi:hypothetical protein
MTKKHFIAIAKIFKTSFNHTNIIEDYGERTEAIATLRRTALQLAEYFRTTSQKFDSERFLDASGANYNVKTLSELHTGSK